MPEYLAPGVYVEETSFRSKSIEGVSTSTTGFVGPTRKGPHSGTPEVITSFGDFERIYGGLDNLDLPIATNYLAHAVRAYFGEGGSRLYVSRVFVPYGDSNPGKASSEFVTDGGAPETQTRFLARFPGSAGNGWLTLSLAETPAVRKSLESAKEGSLVRIGDPNLAPKPATLEGGPLPLSIGTGGKLFLRVTPESGAAVDSDVTISSALLELTGDAAPKGADLPAGADPLPAKSVLIDQTNNEVQITANGATQVIKLNSGVTTFASLAAQINSQLRGATARATDADRIAIAAVIQGKRGSLAVPITPLLGFTTAQSKSGTEIAENTVNNAQQVSAEEIDAILRAKKIPVRASKSPKTGNLVLTTNERGPNVRLAIRKEAGSAHTALGLPETAGAGKVGTELAYYIKDGSTYKNADKTLDLSGLDPTAAPGGHADLLTMNVVAVDADGHSINYEGLAFDPRHPTFIQNVLKATPTRRTDYLENPYAIEVGSSVSGFDLFDALFGADDIRIVGLSGGNDGAEPGQIAYETALAEFLKLEDISIVAAPGSSAYSDLGIQNALVSHAETLRAYRIAVLDTPPESAISDARNFRSRFDSTHAAIYYPWVLISNPLFRPGLDNVPREITVPPSGYICGIYARNDVERGVWKAPANEVVRGALRFESDVNFAQQGVLNPMGVNCLRYFPGRGYRVWGARTASSDPEWKYVNVRRYFNFLEASIDRGTQWAVFEPNGYKLWANITDTISSFLYDQWLSGALLGASAQEAFFVRCDRSTMTQNNLDNGQLICLIGVAVVKPAEFVIFRIGQKTADSRS